MIDPSLTTYLDRDIPTVIPKSEIDKSITKHTSTLATALEQALIPGVHASNGKRKVERLKWPALLHRHAGAMIRLLWIDGSLPTLEYIGEKEDWKERDRICCLCANAPETADHIFLDCPMHQERRATYTTKLSNLLDSHSDIIISPSSPWRSIISKQNLLLEWGADLDDDVRKRHGKNATFLVLNFLRDAWQARCVCFELSLEFLRKNHYNFVSKRS